jgi:hypothetical protein
VHVDVLHGDLLLALAAVALQRLQLLAEHAQQLGGIAGRGRIIGVVLARMSYRGDGTTVIYPAGNGLIGSRKSTPRLGGFRRAQ